MAHTPSSTSTPPPSGVRPNYPVILIPPRLEAALNAQPPLPPFPQPCPIPEDFPADLPVGRTVAAALMGRIGFKVQADELLAPARLEARHRYEAALTHYEQTRLAFEAVEAAKLTPKHISAFRRRQVAALLESSAVESLAESKARMGRAESHLYERLAAHFPDLIQRRRMLKAGANDYHPDYLLFHPAHQLRIDIELDEPYALRLKLPTHFVERTDDDLDEYSSSDDIRDQAVLRAGWVVIRFSEQQAVSDPDGCARVMADLVKRLTGQPIPPSLATTPAVKIHPRWTRLEANEMASQDTRLALLTKVKEENRGPAPRPIKPQRPFVPSEHQQRIFDFLAHEQGHGLVIAVAGSGKSTTLLESVRIIKSAKSAARIILLAFNKSIRQELKLKLHDAGFTDVETATLNGFGNAAIIADRGRENTRLTRHKDRGMLKKAAGDLGVVLSEVDLKNAVNLYGKFQSYIDLDPASLPDFQRLAEQYQVNRSEHLQPLIARALDRATEAYTRRGEYTLDEQNYLPVKLELPIQSYDFVLVDECQDLTQTQLRLVLRAAGEHGRLLFVGDPSQAIMGFRGADNNSVQNIRQLPSAPTELPLTVCYRCPTSHITLAQEITAQIKPHPGAPAGQVHYLDWEAAFDYVQEGDLMFSRQNRLVDWVVLELLARGLTLDYTAGAAKAEPGDPEENDTQPASRVVQVVDALKRAAADLRPGQHPRSVVKPQLTENDKPLETLLDWTLGEIYQQAKNWDAGAFPDYLELLTRPDERLGVKVASAHQSKGLEARRVFVMGYPTFGTVRPGRPDWEREQEQNLKYVALTRSKETLHLVDDPKYR